jgi:L-2-hydroxyglutarate oxidase LhgO
MIKGMIMMMDSNASDSVRMQSAIATLVVFVASAMLLFGKLSSSSKKPVVLKDLVDRCPPLEAKGDEGKVQVTDMYTGGSGSWNAVKGVTVGREIVKCRYVINCAGSASDKIARMIGDDSFYIKPRLGDYLLLNRNQGHLTQHTIFPCPDPVLGKGVLVQTTLWGNLILGPTARDVNNEEARDMSAQSVQEYILSKCKQLCPYFDPKETFHAFCGARSKSSRGDWIIEPSAKDGHFIHVAGIDSPGLAGSPAIAIEVVRLLQEAGLETPPNKSFNPNRAPIITPKAGKFKSTVKKIQLLVVSLLIFLAFKLIPARHERAQNGTSWQK